MRRESKRIGQDLLAVGQHLLGLGGHLLEQIAGNHGFFPCIWGQLAFGDELNNATCDNCDGF